MSRIVRWLILLAAALCPISAAAHEVRPAYLELREIEPGVYDGLWKVPALGDKRLGIYIALPDAAEAVGEPVALMSDGAYIERWRFRIDGGLGGQVVRIDGLEATAIDVLARVEHLSGVSQAERLMPNSPFFTVAESPSQLRVGATYFALGIEHILLGIDHLLFVLALMLLVTGWKQLAATITTFTVAHSITLALAALGLVRVPGPPVEAFIALSIVFVAAEIVRSRQGEAGLTERAPWVVSFVFGLVHGLGFAGALSEVGVPQHAIPMALLFFNVGVEAGQLAFVAAVLCLIAMLARTRLPMPAWSWRVVPYCIGSVAMYWVIERTGRFLF